MNRDELSVYADQLQIEGDIRGEIIALERLLEHGKRPELVARHEMVMKKWLGPSADDPALSRSRSRRSATGSTTSSRSHSSPTR
jgi:hypothetical protein